MICDLAEYYGIYNYRDLPLRTVATLACGLRGGSRVIKDVSGVGIDSIGMLLASACDSLRWLVWAKTKDAEHGRNMPESILSKMINAEPPEAETLLFDSPEAFEAARRKIIEEG